MPAPTQKSHLLRLAGILILAGVGLVVARSVLVPPSWNSDESHRDAALAELQEKPMKYGGNQSCIDCHQDKDGLHKDMHEELSAGAHKSLSCESCHGPLADHVQDNQKIAQAKIEYTGLVCLHCHNNLISRPATHPRYVAGDEELTPQWESALMKAAIEEGEKRIFRHKKSNHASMDCVECHQYFHDPET